MNESEILLDVAVLGEQVRQFLNSDIGKYLLQHARGEEEDAIRKLVDINYRDADGILSLQNKIWRAKSVRSWLDEAVTAGLKAQTILEDRED